MRGQRANQIWLHHQWYTLTYNEGTRHLNQLPHLLPIYPHIQWGNIWKVWNLLPRVDIPSHTVRELSNLTAEDETLRYTLTYSEGTSPAAASWFLTVIYPHIQWGNFHLSVITSLAFDIPSHTVGEHSPAGLKFCYNRYTLTYSEGTMIDFSRISLSPIYPHIQWGN